MRPLTIGAGVIAAVLLLSCGDRPRTIPSRLHASPERVQFNLAEIAAELATREGGEETSPKSTKEIIISGIRRIDGEDRRPAESAGVYVRLDCPLTMAGVGTNVFNTTPNDGILTIAAIDNTCIQAGSEALYCALSTSGVAKLALQLHKLKSIGCTLNVEPSSSDAPADSGVSVGIDATDGLPPDADMEFKTAAGWVFQNVGQAGPNGQSPPLLCGRSNPTNGCATRRTEFHLKLFAGETPELKPSEDNLFARVNLAGGSDAWLSNTTDCTLNLPAVGQLASRSDLVHFQPRAVVSSSMYLCTTASSGSYNLSAYVLSYDSVTDRKEVVADPYVSWIQVENISLSIDEAGHPTTTYSLVGRSCGAESLDQAAIFNGLTFTSGSGGTIVNKAVDADRINLVVRSNSTEPPPDIAIMSKSGSECVLRNGE